MDFKDIEDIARAWQHVRDCIDRVEYSQPRQLGLAMTQLASASIQMEQAVLRLEMNAAEIKQP